MPQLPQDHPPITIRQIVAALQALGGYSGENTAAAHAEEIERLGCSEAFFRLLLLNALLGTVEHAAMSSEVDAAGPGEGLLEAHWQALEVAGATRTPAVLLNFLCWRVLRVTGPLRQLVQDQSTGPIPLAAVHAAEALRHLLQVAAAGQAIDPDRFAPAPLIAGLHAAKQALNDAEANLDLMLDLLKKYRDL